MTATNYSTSWTNATNAGFQAWGSALSSAMRTCGLAATADTGQINWSTVAVPTTNNTVAGYEMYKFTDTLQATYPVFIKIEYGSGPNQSGGNYPQIWVTVGTGTDGAGNLTGTTTVRQNLICNYNAAGGISSTSTPYPTYVCFDGSYLGACHKIGSISTYNGGGFVGGMFMVGRQTDNNGNYIGGSVTLITSPINAGSTVYVFTIQSLNLAYLSAPVANAPTTATTGGTLTAATYYYKITATNAVGETIASNEVSVTTTGTTSANTITWAAVSGATGYKIYRGTAAAGENVFYSVGSVVTFTDTGAANTAGSPPTTNTASNNTLYSNGNGYYSFIPFSMTASAYGAGNYQIFPCYGSSPLVYPLNWCAYGIVAETAQGNTVSATIVGSTAQTFLMTGNASLGAATPSSANYALFMKYQ